MLRTPVLQLTPDRSVILVKDNKIFYNKAFGYADVQTKKPLQTDHIFRIASQTKAITSVAVMML